MSAYSEDQVADLVQHLQRGQVPNWFIDSLPKGTPGPGPLSRSEHLTAALESLGAVQFETGNDHPGYDRLKQILTEVYSLRNLFWEAS